jgi:hypothetical protein
VAYFTSWLPGKESRELSAEHQVIRGKALSHDTKFDTDGSSTGLPDVAPSRTESTLVQVRPLDAVEEKPLETALGR